MFQLRQPTDVQIRTFLAAQAKFGYSYPDVGATAATPPANYDVDHTRIRLGEGEEVFARAKHGLHGWRQFELEWLRAYPPDAPIQPTQVVAVVARTFGIWSMNAARIAYVVDEPRRFGFAYGTLPGHVERGEERFLVEQSNDGSIWYDIVAFSQPRHLFTKIGYPLVRRLQKRFGRQSAAAMIRVVQSRNCL